MHIIYYYHCRFNDNRGKADKWPIQNNDMDGAALLREP